MNTTTIQLTRSASITFVRLTRSQYERMINKLPAINLPEVPDGMTFQSAYETPGYFRDAVAKAYADRATNLVYMVYGYSSAPNTVIDFADADFGTMSEVKAKCEEIEQGLKDISARNDIEYSAGRTAEDMVTRGKMIASVTDLCEDDVVDAVMKFRDDVFYEVLGYVRQDEVAAAIKSDGSDSERPADSGSDSAGQNQERQAASDPL